MEINRIGDVVVLVSANVEWRIVAEIFPEREEQPSPYGGWFVTDLEVIGRSSPVVFFHGGWGKIAAAGSTQYAINRWSPKLLVNLGTCGGFEGSIERGATILAERTVVYDIIEQMGDNEEHIAHYSTAIDLSWLGESFPVEVQRTLLVSGDRDLVVDEISGLHERFGAVAGDWESGAIAFVAARNYTRLLILRGVTDLVGSSGGEAYGDIEVFVDSARTVMGRLIENLPAWLAI